MLQFHPRGDERGWLVAVEGMKDIPFEIKRIFYIYGTKGDAVRGKHANRRSEFVLINVCGECKVRTDNGYGERRSSASTSLTRASISRAFGGRICTIFQRTAFFCVWPARAMTARSTFGTTKPIVEK